MSNIKCPFCQQELECCGAYIYGTKKLGCANCGLTGDSKLFLELISTRKALDVAVDAIDKILVLDSGKFIQEPAEMWKIAKSAKDQITTILENKNVNC